ncbi:MAG: hemolysin family protein [Synergistaceae bacterium]|nr:hemolysin family protein [Synergistaceae bacterium]
MSSDLVGSIGLLLVFLLMSFYFSATETAITAAGKMKLKALENTYPNRKKGFEWLADNIQKALTATLVGNNIVNIAAASLATTVCVSMFGRNGPIIAVTLTTSVVVVFCEILPKVISIGYKEQVLNRSLPVLSVFYLVMSPVVYVVNGLVWCIGRLLGLRLDVRRSFVTRADFEMMIRESSASGALEEDESKMIHGVIAFEETRVSEVMVPRTDMMAVTSDTTVADASAIFMQTGHSRVPAYQKELDKITGVLYAKDLLGPLSGGMKDEKVEGLLRAPLFIPETIKTDEAFELMKRSQIHIAIVVDEYGGTAGLVTLEDLIEEIVGDIQDEYDDETPDVLDEGGGSYLVQGYVNLEDLSETLGYPFEFDDVDTVAGMLLTIIGGFPEEGQSVRFGPWKISAVEVAEHRILQVRMELQESGEASAEGENSHDNPKNDG